MNNLFTRKNILSAEGRPVFCTQRGFQSAALFDRFIGVFRRQAFATPVCQQACTCSSCTCRMQQAASSKLPHVGHSLFATQASVCALLPPCQPHLARQSSKGVYITRGQQRPAIGALAQCPPPPPPCRCVRPSAPAFGCGCSCPCWSACAHLQRNRQRVRAQTGDEGAVAQGWVCSRCGAQSAYIQGAASSAAIGRQRPPPMPHTRHQGRAPTCSHQASSSRTWGLLLRRRRCPPCDDAAAAVADVRQLRAPRTGDAVRSPLCCDFHHRIPGRPVLHLRNDLCGCK